MKQHFIHRVQSFAIEVVQEENDFSVRLWHKETCVEVASFNALSDAIKEALDYVEHAKLHYALRTLNNLV